MTVYELWATVQHLMGIDHQKLTYHFGGRDYRLSDVEGTSSPRCFKALRSFEKGTGTNGT